MLLHINPTRQQGKRTGSFARASGWYMTFFAAGVIAVSNALLVDLLLRAPDWADQVLQDHLFELFPGLRRGGDAAQEAGHVRISTAMSGKPLRRASLVRNARQPCSTAAARCRESMG